MNGKNDIISFRVIDRSEFKIKTTKAKFLNLIG